MASVVLGTNVLNCSFGSDQLSTTVRLALNTAYQMNVVCVGSAEDHLSGAVANNAFPAAWPGVIGVAATTSRRQRAEFSSPGDYMDVSAPGEYIWSTSFYPNNGTAVPSYDPFGGTSASAPEVSGTSGLLLSYEGSLSNDDIEQILRRSATNVSVL